MLRSLSLGGVAAAALSSACCWRPFCGPGPVLYNPPPVPLFPRLHPGYWAGHLAPPAVAPAAPAPISASAGPDCPGCVGGFPPGAVPIGGGGPQGGLPPGGVPFAAAPAPLPTSVLPPPGLLAAGPQYTPQIYGGPPPLIPNNPSTPLPMPAKTAGEPPPAVPMR
jgi:hypothetical protein